MAILLREIKANVINLAYEPIQSQHTPKLIVKGEVEKEIFYVTNDGLVRKQDALVSFNVTMEIQPLISVEDQLKLDGEIEHIRYQLVNDGTQVDQQFILLVRVTTPDSNFQDTQHYLIRSVDQLIEPKPKVPETDAKDEKTIESPTEIIPIPDFTQMIEEKMVALRSDLESNLHQKLEYRIRQELEPKIRNEMEWKLKQELQAQLQAQLQLELAEKWERLLEEERHNQRMMELEKEEKQRQARERIKRRSVEQKIHGYRVKNQTY